MKSLIIERPDLQTLKQRYAYGTLTLIFWVLWFYMWVPSLGIVAWLTGINLVYINMVTHQGLEDLTNKITWYGLTILLIGLALIVWAQINLWRFRDKERRTRSPHLDNKEMASHYGVDPARLDHWQSCKILSIEHEEHGVIKSIKEL